MAYRLYRALFTISLTWLYHSQSARAQYILVSLMATMFGLMTFLIVLWITRYLGNSA